MVYGVEKKIEAQNSLLLLAFPFMILQIKIKLIFILVIIETAYVRKLLKKFNKVFKTCSRWFCYLEQIKTRLQGSQNMTTLTSSLLGQHLHICLVTIYARAAFFESYIQFETLKMQSISNSNFSGLFSNFLCFSESPNFKNTDSSGDHVKIFQQTFALQHV